MSFADSHTFGAYSVDGAGPERKGPEPQVMRAHTLVGKPVYNPKGEGIGDLKEILLDMRSGRVSYAVLSLEPLLSKGPRLFAVPWNALTLDTEHQRFVLSVENEGYSQIWCITGL